MDEQRVNYPLESLREVQGRLAELESFVAGLMAGGVEVRKSQDPPCNTATRARIAKISDEVVHSNPYSRLMALQKMGIVSNYEHVRDLSVAIVGVGGVGGCAAEMLARCGVGKLILFDYDRVEMANMNRMFYQPIHVGMSKVEAASAQLRLINPDVTVETCDLNISSISDYPSFLDRLEHGSLTGQGEVDLVLSCVDNYEARLCINKACNSLNKTWMESGVSETGVDGHIQLIVPGLTACFACVPPLVVANGIDEKTLKRDGVCAASLPTTMTLIASLLVQNTLKLLLKFGSVSTCISYSGVFDHFGSLTLKPNPNCTDQNCVNLQKQGKNVELNFVKAVEEQEIAHVENEWGMVDRPNDANNHCVIGIEMMGTNEGTDAGEIPMEQNNDNHVDSAEERSVEDLRDQFNALCNSE